MRQAELAWFCRWDNLHNLSGQGHTGTHDLLKTVITKKGSAAEVRLFLT